MFTNKELSYILYNNRSISNVVNNFLPLINPFIINKIEYNLEKSKSSFIYEQRMVEIRKDELDISSNDILVSPSDLESLTQLVIENIGKFKQEEYDYLIQRGIKDDIIKKWSLFGLSSIKEFRHLEVLGATCHPILRKILNDGLENGGIVIPLFENDKLTNCAIRKINSDNALKYSLSCPDIPVWGLSDIKELDDIWITEGLFDMMAMVNVGKKSVSCSSAMWTSIQLYKVLEKKPKTINIFSDNDEVGLRTSGILKCFFEMYKIPTTIFISKFAKDASEHFFQRGEKLEDLIKVDSVDLLLKNNQDNSFDFLKHLKNRKI